MMRSGSEDAALICLAILKIITFYEGNIKESSAGLGLAASRPDR